MQDYFEHIDAYKSDELSTTDKADFEAAMLKDEDLRLAVDNIGLVKKTVLDILELDIRDTIKGANDKNNVSTLSKKWWLLLAFFVLLSISALTIYLFHDSEVQAVNYASLQIIDPIYNTERSATVESTITKAVSLHLAGKSDQALALLKSQEPLNHESKYWIMEIMISQKQVINDAWIAELESSQYQPKRISYLKIINMVLQGNKNKARSTLRDVSTDKLGVREYNELQKYLSDINN